MPLFDEIEGEDNEIFVMGTCSDIFHKACLTPWLKTCIDNSQFPIKCPDPRCKMPIPMTDLRELLTPEERERAQKFEWKQIRDQNANI